MQSSLNLVTHFLHETCSLRRRKIFQHFLELLPELHYGIFLCWWTFSERKMSCRNVFRRSRCISLFKVSTWHGLKHRRNKFLFKMYSWRVRSVSGSAAVSEVSTWILLQRDWSAILHHLCNCYPIWGDLMPQSMSSRVVLR